MTSHDLENSCQVMQIDAKTGFNVTEKIATENHKVFAACRLNSGVDGVSMTLRATEEQPDKDILILGCSRGYLLKFEKGAQDQVWTKTGECRLEQSVVDVLQIHSMTVLAVQDEGTFDVIDVASMHSIGHTPTLNGIFKSYKTRMTQRSGGLAIADSNGFFFAKIVSDNAGHHNISLTGEAYCRGQAVNDFIEFKRDNFFVSILEANCFAIMERPEGHGFFDSVKITKIRSVCDGYMSMGMALLPGPRLESAFVMVRDRRGVQLINLKTATSHQLMLSAVPVQYTDIDFMKLIYDEQKHETHLVTLYYEDYPKKLVQSLDMSAVGDREGNKPLLALYSFSREFQSGMMSLLSNSIQQRTLH